MFKKIVGLGLAAFLTIGLTACGSDSASSDKGTDSSDTSAKATVGEQVDYKIIGIDPGAGIMKATASAIEEYELEKWELVEGSGAAMTAALKKAYDDKEPIIVTGWTPHWMFAKFDLKYLDDPKGTYGGEEHINTVVRNGLKEDLPNAYKFLDQFYWTADDMNSVMVEIQEGTKPEEAAAKWIDAHADKVAEWTNGVEKVDGKELSLVYPAWDSEIASTNVVKIVLEDLGFEVTISQVEAGPAWAGVADGSVDGMVAAWLPVTHADYYKEFEGQFEDLGENLEGTKIGLTVPTYMDIDSIEDLKE